MYLFTTKIIATPTTIDKPVINAVVATDINLIIDSTVLSLSARSGLIGSISVLKNTLCNLFESLIDSSTISVSFSFNSLLLSLVEFLTKSASLTTFPAYANLILSKPELFT
ncbi:hypothetical protein DCBHLPFO_00658 [Mycoplasmopsis arginini]|uniref:Uncharacterized protein n=1 Tax=Mycoplasmopsis arginini TaxID=2094 RepID=A0AA43QZ40_MYCAR|nr:hypothetical protein [Mycoplasmopsis arginini]